MSGDPPQPWERPWTIQEMQAHAANWSLAGDAGLLNYLTQLSEEFIEKMQSTANSVDSLFVDLDKTYTDIVSARNNFTALAHSQFVENRVAEEEESASAVVAPVESSKPSTELNDAQMRTVLNNSLAFLNKMFEPVELPAGSDSEDEDSSPGGRRLLLKPINPYANRPLPHIIGTKEFEQDDTVGLVFTPSDEEDDVDLAINSPAPELIMPSHKSQQMYGSSSDESELALQSEEEEEDDDNVFSPRPPIASDIHAQSKRLVDELSRNLGETNQDNVTQGPIAQQRTTPSVTSFPALDQREPPDLFGDDEEEKDDAIFGPIHGTFSGGRGLFEDISHFTVPSIPALKSTDAPPLVSSKEKIPPEKSSIADELFADDADDEGLFSATHTVAPRASKNSVRLFSDEDDLFAVPSLPSDKPHDIFTEPDSPILKVKHPPKPTPRKKVPMQQVEPEPTPEPTSPMKKMPAGAVSIFGGKQVFPTSALHRRASTTSEESADANKVSKISETQPVASTSVESHSITSKPLEPEAVESKRLVNKTVSLFDENDSEEDLFSEKKISVPQRSNTLITSASDQTRFSLFGESDDENFLVPKQSITPSLTKDSIKIASKAPETERNTNKDGGLFDDDIKEKLMKTPATVSLFSDDDDSSSIRQTSPVKNPVMSADHSSKGGVNLKVSLFTESDTDDDLLFSSASSGSSRSSKLKDSTKPSARVGLFSDNLQINKNESTNLFGDDDLFSTSSISSKNNPVRSQPSLESIDDIFTTVNETKSTEARPTKFLDKSNQEKDSDDIFHQSKSHSNVAGDNILKSPQLLDDIFVESSNNSDDLFNPLPDTNVHVIAPVAATRTVSATEKQIESVKVVSENEFIISNKEEVKNKLEKPKNIPITKNIPNPESPDDLFGTHDQSVQPLTKPLSLFDSSDESNSRTAHPDRRQQPVPPKKPTILTKKPVLNTSGAVVTNATQAPKINDSPLQKPSKDLPDKVNISRPKTIEVSSTSTLLEHEDDLFLESSSSVSGTTLKPKDVAPVPKISPVQRGRELGINPLTLLPGTKPVFRVSNEPPSANETSPSETPSPTVTQFSSPSKVQVSSTFENEAPNPLSTPVLSLSADQKQSTTVASLEESPTRIYHPEVTTPTEEAISFDDPTSASILHCPGKDRIRIQQKRKPSTRRGRQRKPLSLEANPSTETETSTPSFMTPPLLDCEPPPLPPSNPMSPSTDEDDMFDLPPELQFLEAEEDDDDTMFQPVTNLHMPFESPFTSDLFSTVTTQKSKSLSDDLFSDEDNNKTPIFSYSMGNTDLFSVGVLAESNAIVSSVKNDENMFTVHEKEQKREFTESNSPAQMKSVVPTYEDDLFPESDISVASIMKNENLFTVHKQENKEESTGVTSTGGKSVMKVDVSHDDDLFPESSSTVSSSFIQDDTLFTEHKEITKDSTQSTKKLESLFTNSRNVEETIKNAESSQNDDLFSVSKMQSKPFIVETDNLFITTTTPKKSIDNTFKNVTDDLFTNSPSISNNFSSSQTSIKEIENKQNLAVSSSIDDVSDDLFGEPPPRPSVLNITACVNRNTPQPPELVDNKKRVLEDDLFEDNDELFSTSSANRRSSPKSSATPSNFASAFSPSTSVSTGTTKTTPSASKKQHFDDIFGDVEQEDLFIKTTPLSKKVSATKPELKPAPVKSSDLFGDESDDENDLFSSSSKVPALTKSVLVSSKTLAKSVTVKSKSVTKVVSDDDNFQDPLMAFQKD